LIRDAGRKEFVCAPAIAERAMRWSRSLALLVDNDHAACVPDLTARERRVLQLIGNGRSTIHCRAARISIRTVKNHVHITKLRKPAGEAAFHQEVAQAQVHWQPACSDTYPPRHASPSEVLRIHISI
jgi:FixJ family two-component response regulator